MRLTNLSPWTRSNCGPLSRPAAGPISTWQQELNQLFEGFFEDASCQPAAREGRRLLAPKVDVSETDQDVYVSAEMPGLSEADIDVEFTGDHLRIRATKKDERDTQRHNFHCVERSFGTWERAIPIPAQIHREQVEATYTQGVLTIRLPKSVSTPASHKVAVKSGN